MDEREKLLKAVIEAWLERAEKDVEEVQKYNNEWLRGRYEARAEILHFIKEYIEDIYS